MAEKTLSDPKKLLETMSKSISFAIVFFIICTFFYTSTCFAQGIVGTWWTEKQESKVKIYEQHHKYYGKLIWAADPAEKVQQHVGKLIIDGFTKQEDGTYKGTIHAPHWGKTFSGKITIESKDVIFLRGYIGLSIFGSTQTWKRVKEE